MKFFKRILTFVFHPSTLLFYKNFRGTVVHPLAHLHNPKYMEILNSTIVRGACIKAFPIGKDECLINIENSYISDECYFSSSGGLTIRNCSFSPKVFIGTYNHGFDGKPDSNYLIEIGNAFIGQGSFISGNIKIEDHSVIGCGSVIKHDVLKDTMVAGNPAKVIKRYDPEKKEWVRTI